MFCGQSAGNMVFSQQPLYMCLGRLGGLNPGITNAQPLFGTMQKHLVHNPAVFQVPGLVFGKDLAPKSLARGLPLPLILALLLQDIALSLGL